MEEKIRLELFTVAELRDWLFHNISVRGLSVALISKTRALAIINNPYVKDDTFIISAIFVNDEVAAYTAVFPELMARPARLVYWDTTLFVAPKYEGRGYASIVIGQICEQYGSDYFDHAAAAASVQNFRFLGLPVSFVPEFCLGHKAFNNSIKGWMLKKLWHFRDVAITHKVSKRFQDVLAHKYILEYVGFVDDETYRFIEANSEGDVFLRTQEAFNWILRYSFDIQSPLLNRVNSENKFSAFVSESLTLAVKVIMANELVGFYILKKAGGTLTVKYLYYHARFDNEVFESLFEHVCVFKTKVLHTSCAKLADFLHATRYFHNKTKNDVSFTYTDDFVFNPRLVLQAGDGDMFS